MPHPAAADRPLLRHPTAAAPPTPGDLSETHQSLESGGPAPWPGAAGGGCDGTRLTARLAPPPGLCPKPTEAWIQAARRPGAAGQAAARTTPAPAPAGDLSETHEPPAGRGFAPLPPPGRRA
jgi:hypothetical protein